MHSQFLWNHSKQHDILQFACQICTLSWDFERKSKDAFSISIRQSKKKKKKKGNIYGGGKQTTDGSVLFAFK